MLQDFKSASDHIGTLCIKELKATLTDFLNNQIIFYVFIDVFCDKIKQEKVHFFKVNHSFKILSKIFLFEFIII